jgi:hypothetical protein
VDRSLHDEITAQELVWLRDPEHVVAWLTHLRYLRNRIQNDIAVDRKALADARPVQVGMTPASYLAFKRQFDARAAESLREIRRIDRDLEEARYCAGYYAISAMTGGNIIDRLVRIGMRLEDGDDDSLDSVLEMIDNLIGHIQQALPGQPAEEKEEV